VLLALYRATDGEHWKNHEGWLGPVGTECDWYGVECKPVIQEHSLGSTVAAIHLSENNLRGSIPSELSELPDLNELYVFGNRITAKLPEVLMQRWSSGKLFVAADPSVFTDVTEIDFEFLALALLCDQHRIILRSDRSAEIYTKKCRNSTARDRVTFCEVKQGKTWPGEFEKLAWLLARNDFYRLQPHYDWNVTDAVFESIRVVKGGDLHEVVEYASGGPLDLWTIQKAIEGVVATTEWNKTARRAKCPKWDESVRKPI
jgi:hypothetical protein